jgi:hypothetical protein
MVNKNYLRSHIHDLIGVIPAPGTEWQMSETPMDKDTHQGHIQYLREEDGGLTKVRDTRWGVVWRTSPQLEEALREVAESIGEDPEDACICLGQTNLQQFAQVSG